MERALDVFGEPSFMKRESGFIKFTWDSSFFVFQDLLYLQKEKKKGKQHPLNFCSIPSVKEVRENPGFVDGKQELMLRNVLKLINYFSSLPLLPVQFGLTLLLFALSLTTCLTLSVLSGDSGNLKPSQGQELATFSANSHKSIYTVIVFQE